MTGLVEISRKLSRFPILLASASLLELKVMAFADVILRSAFNSPIEAATELTRILMDVMVFSVLSFQSVTKDHVEVDLAEPLFTEIGLITPPIGLNEFVLRGVIGAVSSVAIFRGITPYWIADILRLALLAAFPGISLYLTWQMD